MAVGDKWGFIDTRGHVVIQPQFKAAFYFWEGGVGTVESDRGYELIDKTGVVLAKGYGFVVPISEGRVPVSRGDMWGYLDLQGNTVIPFVYEGVREFRQGLAAACRGKKWGYINRDGQVVIPFQFDMAGEFGKGLAPARRDQETGFINQSGEFVIHLGFRYASGFMYGDPSPFLTEDGRFGYVNSSGKVIWGPVAGIPDHWPILGWSEKAKVQSCEGIPRSMKDEIAKFPVDKK